MILIPEYLVTLPIAGTISKIIEADDEEDAIDQALNDVNSPFGTLEMVNGWELEELETYEHLVEGNVCHVCEPDAQAVEQ